VTSNCLQGVYSQAFKPPYWLAYNKDVARHAEIKVFNRARRVTCKTTHAIALDYMLKKRQIFDTNLFFGNNLNFKQVTGAVRKQCGSFDPSMNQATVLKVVDAFLVRGVVHLNTIFKPSFRLPPLVTLPNVTPPTSSTLTTHSCLCVSTSSGNQTRVSSVARKVGTGLKYGWHSSAPIEICNQDVK
jgi:hypothetical protein